MYFEMLIENLGVFLWFFSWYEFFDWLFFRSLTKSLRLNAIVALLVTAAWSCL